VAFRSTEFPGQRYSLQVAPEDCTGCGVCVDVCPAKSKEAAALRASKPVQNFVMALTEMKGQVPETKLFNRGDHDQPRRKQTHWTAWGESRPARCRASLAPHAGHGHLQRQRPRQSRGRCRCK
jgi:ferredoxin